MRGNTDLVRLEDPISDEGLNVFFDENEFGFGFEPIGFEVMKQHALFAGVGENTWGTGWRLEGTTEDWWLSGGDEVRGGWRASPDRFGVGQHDWLRNALRDTRWSVYTTAGLRGFRLDDKFHFLGVGSILGRTEVATVARHDVIGPQLGLGAVAEVSMFRFEATLLGLVGPGRAEITQHSAFGVDAIPGALNRSAIARQTVSEAPRVVDDYVAWQGEARLTASCQLTQRLRFDAVWRGVTTGPVKSAAEATRFRVPDFGINPHDGGQVDFGAWFFGLTYTQ